MRRVKIVVIEAEGRDRGKAFEITEASATRAEAWATRAFLALARGGVDVPEDLAAGGFAGLLAFGVGALATVSYADAEPLLAEMLGAVRMVPDRKNPGFSRDLVEDDIEEVATLLKLRQEIVDLHLGFSTAGALSRAVPAEGQA